MEKSGRFWVIKFCFWDVVYDPNKEGFLTDKLKIPFFKL